MEDQDRETRIDEDVEGHSHKGSHKLANDEGDDVEGHMHKNAANQDSHKLANDEGDDVEGHMHKNARTRACTRPKASGFELSPS